MLTRRVGRDIFDSIKELAVGAGAELRQYGSLSGFYTPPDAYNQVVEIFASANLPLHTLEAHVGGLKRLYSRKYKQLGQTRFLELPQGMVWQVFEPVARNFVRLSTIVTPRGSSALVQVDSVLRTFYGGNPTYYWFRGINKDGTPAMYNVEKRAAYNITVPYLKPAVAYWAAHPEQGFGVVPEWQLSRSIPDDIFDALIRLRPTAQKIPGLFIFDSADFELVRVALSYMSIDLRVAKQVVKLPFHADKLHGAPVVPLADVPSSRLAAFLHSVKELAAVDWVEGDPHIVIHTPRGPVRLAFVYSPHGSGTGDGLYISIDVLSDPESVAEALQEIIPQFGAEVSKNSINKSLACAWPPDDGPGAAYCTTVFIQNYGDGIFASKFLSNPARRAVIEKWVSEVSASESSGGELVLKAREISRILHR